jgi:hypothetical protein
MLLICSLCQAELGVMGRSDTTKIKLVVCIRCFRDVTFEHPRGEREIRPVADRIEELRRERAAAAHG